MDQFSEKQVQIGQRRADLTSRYPELWSQLVTEWSSSGTGDRVWLMYSANYLFRTNNVRWAIDPLTLSWRLKGAPKIDAGSDLKHVSFVLLTHCHEDHLDFELLSALRHLPIKWVIPESVSPTVIEEAGFLHHQIITPIPLQPIELNGIRILPFDGLHRETTSDGTLKGGPAVGYLIEMNGKRWLFPGDTRTYDASRLPDLGPVDHLFAHLWLGRSCALMEEPPLMDAFCQFCLALRPRQIVLAHLHELGRDADELWDDSHAQKICLRLRTIASDISVEVFTIGESLLL